IAVDQAIERKPWQSGLAPNFIGLFLWIAFYDQLAAPSLKVGGLVPSLLGAIVAGLLGYLLLFYVPAMWGLETGRPLVGVAASTFGEAGATWIPGLLLGVAQVVWFAVAIHYATDFTLKGLGNFSLLDPQRL